MSPGTSQIQHWLAIASGWLLTIGLPIWLVLSGARLVMTDAYLHLEYSRPDFPPDPYGFTQEDRQAYAPYALYYLQNDEGVAYLGDLTFPDGTPMYTPRELHHMADVKAVTQAALAAYGVLSLTLLIVAARLYGSPRTRLALRQGMRRAGYGTLAALLALVGLIVLNWDAFFEGFHRLFFEDGTWRFEYSDTLIRLFPEQFWFDAALTIGILTAGGAVLLVAAAWLWERRSQANAKRVHAGEPCR